MAIQKQGEKMSLGNNIKTFRKKLGLTQEELASQLYVTSQAVSKWESENGLPDTAQIVPIAKALNVTTDALFGMDSNTTDYDNEEAEKIKIKANELRDSTDSTSGAILAADYLDSECEKHPYNYEILMRYVQATAHLSRFADFNQCFKDNPEKWNQYVQKAINRGYQVIRYSNDSSKIDLVHFATAWIYIHNKEYDKAWEHINVLPSIESNQLREGISAEVAMMQYGKEAWQNQLRIDLQNFTRAINKVMVYASETYCFAEPMETSVEFCNWALNIIHALCKNPKLKPLSQGFYRDITKYKIASYLKNGNIQEAVNEYNSLKKVMEDYTNFCQEQIKNPNTEKDFGTKAFKNMEHYTKEFAQSKLQYILQHLKEITPQDSFEKFQKLI